MCRLSGWAKSAARMAALSPSVPQLVKMISLDSAPRRAATCDRGLEDRVAIERTGCLKRCSQAPNMVLMPGKTRLSGMEPDAIVTLLEHL